uniref:CCHC-type domain-containing protein n=1 Tax=Tanacetum cinerariifolium TaxID=118510 RepID=A0A6L2N467_TANCI|nr:hypothetical protein [Tanacetum cinerariifolium]
MNTASTSGSGPLPSNIFANPKGELKAITTRSGLVLDGPSVPMPPPFINLEEDERVEETLTNQDLAEYTIKYQKMLKALLSNKEKLLELENTPLNENCSAIILKKLPEKLEEPGKFLILVLLILGRPLLRTARALIDIHGEEMILRDGDERLTLNMIHDTSSYSNQPKKESINMINIYDDSYEDYLEDLSPSPHNINPLSGSTTFSSNHLLEEFADELALITFPPGNDDLPFAIESDLREIEYLLNHDPTKEMDSILKDSVDEDNLVKTKKEILFSLLFPPATKNPNDKFFYTIPEMFTDEHALDYSSPPLYDNFYDDLNELSLIMMISSDFLSSPEYDSFLFEDFSEVMLCLQPTTRTKSVETKGPTSGIRAIWKNFELEEPFSINKRLFSDPIESLSPRVVAAAKLPILNPNEFDLWKMRIKQYFLMTNYSVWEVILNGDSPTPTRVVHGVVQAVSPTTVEQRLAKKNELKARGTLLMALPDKNQSKFNTHKDAKYLMEAIEKSQSNSPQLDNDDIKQIDADDLEEMDLQWQMAMLTIRAMRFLQRTRRNLGANGTTFIGFDMSKVECYNCHRRCHFARECSVMVLVGMIGAFRQMKNQQTMPSWHLPPSTSLSSSDNEVAPYTKACSKAYATLQLHYDKMTNDLRLGYDTQVFSSTVFDCDELLSFEIDDSESSSPMHNRYKLEEGYYAVPPPYTAPKPDLVFHDAPTVSATVPNVLNVKPSTTKPNKEMSQSHRPSAPIIEDWVSDSEDESKGEPMPTQKAPSFVETSKHVKTPRTSVKPVEHPTPAENLRKDIPKSRGHRHSWNRKACFVCKSLNHLIKDRDYYDKKMVQKLVRNHAMRGNPQHYERMTHPHTNRHVVPTSVLTRSRLVPLNATRPVTTAVPQTNVPA